MGLCDHHLQEEIIKEEVACDPRIRDALDIAADPATIQCSLTSLKLFIVLSKIHN